MAIAVWIALSALGVLLVLRRLMWGSNWPMHWPELGYAERLDAVRTHLPALAALSPRERAFVLGETARSLWPVGGRAAAAAGEDVDFEPTGEEKTR